jgi:hypothetical protein
MTKKKDPSIVAADVVTPAPRPVAPAHTSIARFAGDMEAQLAKTKYGATGGWEDEHFSTLLTRLYEEAADLKQALLDVLFEGDHDYERIIAESAAVAIFAMMIADKVRQAL